MASVPYYFGQGIPDNLGLPTDLTVEVEFSPDVWTDVSEYVDRPKTEFSYTSTAGSGRAHIVLSLPIDYPYQVYDTTRIRVYTKDPVDLSAHWPTGWANDGSYIRLWHGLCMEPDVDTTVPDETVVTISAVDNGWWEKYPPKNAGLPWPPSGVAFVDTVFVSGWSSGSNVAVQPYRMINVYAGKGLWVANPDGLSLERITVNSVNYPHQLRIEQQIDAAGVHTVTVTDMTDITVGERYHIWNVSDGTHWETIEVTATSGGPTGPGTFTANFVNSHKTGAWILYAGTFRADFDFDHTLFQTTVAAGFRDYGKLHTVHPLSMSGIEAGMQLLCSNADLSFQESVSVLSIDSGAGTFDAIFAWPKSSNWVIRGTPTLFGGPTDKEVLSIGWWQNIDHIQQYVWGLYHTFYDDAQETRVTPAISAGLQWVTPASMENIIKGRQILCQDSIETFEAGMPPSHSERVDVVDVSATQFRANFSYPKVSGWTVFNGPYIDKSGVEEVQPSVTITSPVRSQTGSVTYSGKSIAQLIKSIEEQSVDIATIVDLPESTTGSLVTIVPRNMYGIKAKKRLWAQNADGSGGETIEVQTAGRTRFYATLSTPKLSGWRLYGRVTPRHAWGVTPDNPAHDAWWLPRPRHYDADIPSDIALRALSDDTLIDYTTEAPVGSLSVRRYGGEHYNAIQVLGRNNSWGRFVDWDSVHGLNGRPADGRVMEASPVVNQDLYTNSECEEYAAILVAQHNFCSTIPRIETPALITPTLFSGLPSVMIRKQFSPLMSGGIVVPISNVRLTFPEGVPYYQIECGDVVPEGIAHAVAGSEGAADAGLGPPVHEVRILRKNGTIERSHTTYLLDTTDAITPSGFAVPVLTATLPDPSLGGYYATYSAMALKVDDGPGWAEIAAPQGSTIDGLPSIFLKHVRDGVQIVTDGLNYYTIRNPYGGFANPHDIDGSMGYTNGDPVIFVNQDGEEKLRFQWQEGADHSLGHLSVDMTQVGISNYEWVDFLYQNGNIDWEIDIGGTGLYTKLIAGFYYATGDHAIATNEQFWSILCVSVSDQTITFPRTDTNEVYNGTVYLLVKTQPTGVATFQPYSGDYLNGVADGTFMISGLGMGLAYRTNASSPGAGWVVQSLGGSGALRRETIGWSLAGTDAGTTGNKYRQQVPSACTIKRWNVSTLDPDTVTGTTTVNFRRRPAFGSWDADPLNPSPVGISASGEDGSTDMTDWTTALDDDDWVRAEIVTADSTLLELDIVLEVEIA